MKIESLGRHILAEFYNCNQEIINDHNLIERYLIDAAKKANATVVESCFHMFNPWGVSGVVVIQESHLTIHTWPELGYASVDLYTCGDEVNPWIAFEYLKEKLQAEKTETIEVPRGMVDKIKRFTKEEYTDVKYKVGI
ncbi:adenosylmethionine decarboxylase proenzyme [Caminicella sporogenes DSM 14501]|uniref:S-adenosylmethionine decarboxylase proenzyme n=1 Tax=Caminicella sporogenes DSM 14501 TaxID=1121266 RepID=A0A1M6L3B4_9FIRM|nr:adenosylmethionine decarboxylase [Caminicella sporogenes]RKD27689.1 S-adenosylmethionine decarboxylase proenzyme [Caminicella sporogenes]SHJ65687.1 adenosylmethionine decarboxylase proenzyme [Caminicella sporogenes DSM 14501]